jgi:hypothetical protein
MTIYVATPDHGQMEFDADWWVTDDGDLATNGELWIGHEETGVGVALFAAGSWLFVYEVIK